MRAVDVWCGSCGSNDVHMTTCDEVNGTGHEWVLGSMCHGCQNVGVCEDGCPQCNGEDPPNPCDD